MSLASNFNGSTSLLFGMGCVDGSGSLSGGAFNQLKLVTLNIVKTFLYQTRSALHQPLLQCANSLYKSYEIFLHTTMTSTPQGLLVGSKREHPFHLSGLHTQQSLTN